MVAGVTGETERGETEETSSADTEEAIQGRENDEEPMEMSGPDDDNGTPSASFAQLLPLRQGSEWSKQSTTYAYFYLKKKVHMINRSITNKSFQSSLYIPSKRAPSRSSTDSFWDIPPLPETDSKLLDKFFLIRGALLLSLFRLCPECGEKLPTSSGSARLTAQGKAPAVHYIYRSCSMRKNPIRRSEGQPGAVEQCRENHFRAMCLQQLLEL
ncbi:hypothetical protein Y032_0328g2627 [Ancylostoma ceylanicum]|nr:hypothetical protein Y032_0328g2627 [Ancylostoma ceylanicum]